MWPVVLAQQFLHITVVQCKMLMGTSELAAPKCEKKILSSLCFVLWEGVWLAMPHSFEARAEFSPLGKGLKPPWGCEHLALSGWAGAKLNFLAESARFGDCWPLQWDPWPGLALITSGSCALLTCRRDYAFENCSRILLKVHLWQLGVSVQYLPLPGC